MSSIVVFTGACRRVWLNGRGIRDGWLGTVAAVVDDDHRAEDWDAAYGMATSSVSIPSAAWRAFGAQARGTAKRTGKTTRTRKAGGTRGR